MLLTFLSIKTRCAVQFIDKSNKPASIITFEYDVIVPTTTTNPADLDPASFTKDFEKELTHLIKDDADLKRKISSTNYRRFVVSVKSTYPELPFPL